ncbi:MAG: DoxX family protein [Alphaproteobacteria bacterium]|jgi:putative oxidoreductase|nr:DoxX family protein [Alphaproteobacteria bacterium]
MSFLDSYAPQTKALLRIMTGLLFLGVGLAKIAHFPHVAMFAEVKPFVGLVGWAGMIELVTGPLIILGFYSRIAAFIASGEMAIAYFYGHWGLGTDTMNSFFPVQNGGATAILYTFIFLYFAASGPGTWALNQK